MNECCVWPLLHFKARNQGENHNDDWPSPAEFPLGLQVIEVEENTFNLQGCSALWCIALPRWPLPKESRDSREAFCRLVPKTLVNDFVTCLYIVKPTLACTPVGGCAGWLGDGGVTVAVTAEEEGFDDPPKPTTEAVEAEDKGLCFCVGIDSTEALLDGELWPESPETSERFDSGDLAVVKSVWNSLCWLRGFEGRLIAASDQFAERVARFEESRLGRAIHIFREARNLDEVHFVQDMWRTLEALYGDPGQCYGGGLSKRLACRAAKTLEKDTRASKNLASDIRSLYSKVRSEISHGDEISLKKIEDRVKNRECLKDTTVLKFVAQLARDSLQRLMQNENLSRIFADPHGDERVAEYFRDLGA